MLLEDADFAPRLFLGNDHAIAGFEVALNNFREMVIVEAELQRDGFGLAVTENPDQNSVRRRTRAIWPRR